MKKILMAEMFIFSLLNTSVVSAKVDCNEIICKSIKTPNVIDDKLNIINKSINLGHLKGRDVGSDGFIKSGESFYLISQSGDTDAVYAAPSVQPYKIMLSKVIQECRSFRIRELSIGLTPDAFGPGEFLDQVDVLLTDRGPAVVGLPNSVSGFIEMGWLSMSSGATEISAANKGKFDVKLSNTGNESIKLKPFKPYTIDGNVRLEDSDCTDKEIAAGGSCNLVVDVVSKSEKEVEVNTWGADLVGVNRQVGLTLMKSRRDSEHYSLQFSNK